MYEPDAVIADKGAVADQPRRDALRRGVRAQHRFGEIVIAVRLVDEAPAVLVHRDQARLGAVEQDVRVNCFLVQRARKIECRAGVLVIHRCAGRARHRKAIAACARKRIRVGDGQTCHELTAQLVVRREPAGRKDHASPGADRLPLVANIDHRALDAILFLHKFDQPCIERDRHVAGAQAVEQPRHQRVTHHQPRAAPVTQAIGRVAHEQLCRGNKRTKRRKWLEQDGYVVFADHHSAEHHERCDRRPHAVEIRAEQSTVEREWRQRAPGKRTARPVGMVVGMFWWRAEFHLRARFKIVERSRTRREIRFAHGLGAWADLGGEKAPRFIDLVRHAVAHRLVRSRYPHRSGGCRRGAADLIGFLA